MEAGLAERALDVGLEALDAGLATTSEAGLGAASDAGLEEGASAIDAGLAYEIKHKMSQKCKLLRKIALFSRAALLHRPHRHLFHPLPYVSFPEEL